MQRIDRRTSARSAYIATCFVAVAGLGFVAGSVATLSEAGPARVVEHAYRAGTALYSKATAVQRSAAVRSVAACAHRAAGRDHATIRPRLQNGLTLYTSGHDQKARLIDMHGRRRARVGRALQPALGQVGGGQERRSPTRTSTSRRPTSIPTAICWRSTSRSATRPGATAWSSTTRTTTSCGSIWPTSITT